MENNGLCADGSTEVTTFKVQSGKIYFKYYWNILSPIHLHSRIYKSEQELFNVK